MVVSDKQGEHFINNNMSHENVTTVTDDDERKTLNKMVIDAKDLLRIRDRISELYFKQNVIVAPCLSKLYMARDCCNTTFDSTIEDPNWVYFGMGIVALIYDHEQNDVKMTLFDRNDVRLMWCLKWTKRVTAQMTMPNFYKITNNVDDENHHIGILYENKDVAELIAQTIALIFESIKEARRYSGVDIIDTTKTPVRPSSSLPLKRALHKGDDRRGSLKDTLLRKVSRINSPTKEQPPQTKLRSATVHQFSGHMARRAIEISTDGRPKSDCTDQTRLLKLSRADSFRKMRSNSFNCDSLEECTTNIKPKKSFSDESSKLRENLTKILFKKRRISRTQSLQVEDRKNSQVLESSNSDESNEDRKQYERSIKLVKPRAFTDTMLLCDSMKFVIEAGLTARNQRERRNWVKTLRTEEMPSTDLCVTEL